MIMNKKELLNLKICLGHFLEPNIYKTFMPNASTNFTLFQHVSKTQ